MQEAVKIIMTTHLYRFNKQVYRQEEGGPIGLELTQMLARLVIICWDDMFSRRCKELKIKLDMYLRYVDDVEMVIRTLPKGTNLTGRRLEV